jgi:hypothetical protein
MFRNVFQDSRSRAPGTTFAPAASSARLMAGTERVHADRAHRVRVGRRARPALSERRGPVVRPGTPVPPEPLVPRSFRAIRSRSFPARRISAAAGLPPGPRARDEAPVWRTELSAQAGHAGLVRPVSTIVVREARACSTPSAGLCAICRRTTAVAALPAASTRRSRSTRTVRARRATAIRPATPSHRRATSTRPLAAEAPILSFQRSAAMPPRTRSTRAPRRGTPRRPRTSRPARTRTDNPSRTDARPATCP